jgi:hypothetical protein
VLADLFLVAIRQVANGSRNQHALFRFDWTETDLNWEHRTILALSLQIHSSGHGSDSCLGHESSDFFRVPSAGLFGNQHLDRSA